MTRNIYGQFLQINRNFTVTIHDDDDHDVHMRVCVRVSVGGVVRE